MTYPTRHALKRTVVKIAAVLMVVSLVTEPSKFWLGVILTALCTFAGFASGVLYGLESCMHEAGLPDPDATDGNPLNPCE